jgi:hypothetical protein
MRRKFAGGICGKNTNPSSSSKLSNGVPEISEEGTVVINVQDRYLESQSVVECNQPFTVNDDWYIDSSLRAGLQFVYGGVRCSVTCTATTSGGVCALCLD